MNHHDRKKQREECTAWGTQALDALINGVCGSGDDQLNFDIASVHYSKWAAHFEMPGETIKNLIAAAAKDHAKCVDMCESPIEKRLLPWLIFEDYGQPIPASTYNPKVDEKPFKAKVLIIPQFAILRFRVDFMVIKPRPNGGANMVAVECDGFDHHNVPRDMQRDGHLAMMGVRTVRASGESITALPRTVSARVAEAMFEMG